MPWGAIVSAGASLLGGALSSKGSKSAANTQAQSASDALALQKEMYDQTRTDQMPFLKTGVAANQKLATLLGLNGTSSGSPQYSLSDLISGDFQPNSDLYSNSPEYKKAFDTFMAQHQAQFGISPSLDKGSDVGSAERQISADGFDPAAYSNSIATQNSSDPQFGSLLRKFSLEDLNSDPVYNSGLQFGLDQGTGAINARAMQSGSYDSGATLKALSRYANDYGTTKANDSYNRYNTDQSNIYNRLSGISGAGQQATNQVSAANTSLGNSGAGLLTDAGSARSAGIVGGANAWGNALSGVAGAANNYSQYQQLQNLFGNGGYNPNYSENAAQSWIAKG